MKVTKKSKTFAEMATKIANLVEEKEKAYGSAFDKTGDFVKLLYPNGAKPEQYKDMLCIVRIFDKLMRIATSYEGTEEKKIDAYSDIIGYGLLGLRSATEEATPEKKMEPERDEDIVDEETAKRWKELALNGEPLINRFGRRLFDSDDEMKRQIDQLKELVKLDPKLASQYDSLVNKIRVNAENVKREKRIKTVATDCMSAFPSETAKTLLHADGTGKEAPKEAEEESPNRWKDLAFKAPLRNRPDNFLFPKPEAEGESERLYLEQITNLLQDDNLSSTLRARYSVEAAELSKLLSARKKQAEVKAACKIEQETVDGPKPEEIKDYFSKREIEFQNDFIPEKAVKEYRSCTLQEYKGKKVQQ